MNIGALPASQALASASALLRPESSEASGHPDRDGDADDSAARVQGPSVNGFGQTVGQTISVTA